MRSRTFLHVSLGILALAAAYHLGVRSAGAQAGGPITGFSTASTSHCSGTFFVISSNGDVYGRQMSGGLCGGSSGPVSYIGNFWGGATPVQQQTLGSVKVRYR